MNKFLVTLSLAKRGDRKCQYKIGQMYESGIFTAKNICLAEKYYRKSAKQGYSKAEYNLGLLYFSNKKYKKSLKWLRKASKKCPEALASLGRMYEQGYGIRKDYTRALNLYCKSIEKGGIKAYFAIAFMYYYGKGVQRDYTQALLNFERSARAGNKSAYFNAGLMYEKGLGTLKNLQKALEYYKSAQTEESYFYLYKLLKSSK